ncbi:MAG: hypothetical protein ACREU6_04915, partial [Steroidobacteraceae bacterium]
DAYSPMFLYFELSTDGAAWERVKGTRHALSVAAGAHTISARVVTISGARGPGSLVKFELTAPRTGLSDTARPASGGASMPPC